MIDISLRDTQVSDFLIFFEQQLEPVDSHLAPFTTSLKDEFITQWTNLKTHKSTSLKTIVVDEKVAGYIVTWEQRGLQEVGYWLGEEYRNKGVASVALSLFLKQVATRPLYAHVSKMNLASIRVLQKCGFTIFAEYGRVLNLSKL